MKSAMRLSCLSSQSRSVNVKSTTRHASCQLPASRAIISPMMAKRGGVACLSSGTDNNSATTVEKKAGVMDSVYNDIFTRSGNEALGYMEEDSAGQSNIFAYEPAKPYVSDDNAKLGSASGGIFATITVAATLAIGFAGGKLYKSALTAQSSELRSLSFYTSSFQSEISTSTNSFSLFPKEAAKEETISISSAADESVAEVAEVAAIAEPAMENISDAVVEVVDIE